jgi:N-omega-hydroxy-L-arginine synthase
MPKVHQDFPKLVPQNLVCKEGKSWHRVVHRDVKSRLRDESDFPCIFSKAAFQKGLLRFVFADSIEPNDIRRLAEGLVEYVDLSRGWNGSLNTAYPLVAAFSRDAIRTQSIEGYHDFGWKVLQKLHEIDPAPWPENVSKDPDAPAWSMCFNGMPLFCNMSHPAHRARRSRNLGEHFLLIINPRERFDIVAGDTPSGRKVRSHIRDRIARYDRVSHCPQLASYGATGAVEWWQYSMSDDNRERADKCPFKFAKETS